MEEFLVVSWWNDFKKCNVVPEATMHRGLEMARKESEKRKNVLGKNSKVILAKIIREF
ncbi:MAG: hypothetical protein AAB514_01765 [Patescibacteria group bacterium]